MQERSIETPLGWMALTERGGAIVALEWRRGGMDRTALLDRAAGQLGAYFAGQLRAFDLPLAPAGDLFQQGVNAAMLAIPYGTTRSYGDLARDLGSAAQPVGAACGRNTIPIVIPCHRVVGANGPGGFSAPGGVETKIALLRHEGAYSLLL